MLGSLLLVGCVVATLLLAFFSSLLVWMRVGVELEKRISTKWREKLTLELNTWITNVTEYTIPQMAKNELSFIVDWVTRITKGNYFKLVSYSFLLTLCSLFIGEFISSILYLFGVGIPTYEDVSFVYPDGTLGYSQKAYAEVLMGYTKMKYLSFSKVVCHGIGLYYLLKDVILKNKFKKEYFFQWSLLFIILMFMTRNISLICDSYFTVKDELWIHIFTFMVLSLTLYIYKKHVQNIVVSFKSFTTLSLIFLFAFNILLSAIESRFDIKYSYFINALSSSFIFLFILNLLFDYLTIITSRIIFRRILKSNLITSIALLSANIIIALCYSFILLFIFSIYTLTEQRYFGSSVVNQNVLNGISYWEFFKGTTLMGLGFSNIGYILYSTTTLIPIIVISLYILISFIAKNMYKNFGKVTNLMYLAADPKKEFSPIYFSLFTIGIVLSLFTSIASGLVAYTTLKESFM